MIPIRQVQRLCGFRAALLLLSQAPSNLRNVPDSRSHITAIFRCAMASILVACGAPSVRSKLETASVNGV